MGLIVKRDELTAEEFIELWKTAGWGEAPSLEQTRLAMNNALFRISVWDDDKLVAMSRMIGDKGIAYYIKDVIVRPEYQHKGIGRIMINELLKFVNDNGIKGTFVSVELAAVPDKAPFYEKLGFKSNEAKRLKQFYKVK